MGAGINTRCSVSAPMPEGTGSSRLLNYSQPVRPCRWILCVVLLLHTAFGRTHGADAVTQPHDELWRNPTDIASRNLYYGPGGEHHQPRGTFSFLEEDRDGVSPKILVRDENGVKWKIKMGGEARPETAASRLLWAVGYYANEDYFLPRVKVRNLPPRLHRGNQFVEADGWLCNARLKRHETGEHKTDHWRWRDNPFLGSREFNGLRVMMSVLSNWDLTDENNAVYDVTNGADGTQKNIYLVSDIGATLGGGRLTWPLSSAKDNLVLYHRSRLISRIRPESVDFQVPDRPTIFFLAKPWEYIRDCRFQWIHKQIPRADARWLGVMLGKLSGSQLRDTFLAAGYSEEEVKGFVGAIEHRIGELKEL